jgi:ribosomal protein S18 acetylase RimI-like enzyme
VLPAARIDSLPPDADASAVEVLSRAFRDSPIDVAVIGGSEVRRLESVRWAMRSSLAAARRGRGALLLGAFASGRPARDPLGVLVGIPSTSIPLPSAPLLAQLRSSFGQGLRAMRRWGRVFRVLERSQPQEPHWYLSLVGVDPVCSGRGIGRDLLASFLAEIDPEGLASYLETDREENLRFYGRAGFEVVSELEVLDTPIWCMLRRPA